MTTPNLVREYGTGLLRTTIVREHDGYRWTRRPGPLAPVPFASETRGISLREVPALDGARLVLGEGGAHERNYRADGHESVAGSILRGGPDRELAEQLRGVGRLLRAIHEHPCPEESAPARGVSRLNDWLSGRASSPVAAHAAPLLEQILGDRLALVRDWCLKLHTDSLVCSHGAAGLGSVIRGTDATATFLLTGEDVCAAPWYLDMGWIVGELVEFRWHLTEQDPTSWELLLDALFDGYGRDLGRDWSVLAALRMLLHVHDFTAYVDWSVDTAVRRLHYIKFLIDL
ncbi:hypothetical protein ACLMAJ_31005 [Nocardia sp. KC 131]|uniref:hypothetical protein n=1 Tax=Nocardia arseniciresistens TaxID=3392119 RepID=UPI00398F29F2